MKTELKVKYLQFLLGKKKDSNEGFTLIELLVVVIIIGVLAVIALPNLLAQVGRARETEARNTVGTLNRAQVAHYTEKGNFTADLGALEVPTATGNYYSFSVTGAGLQFANGINNNANSTRDYVGAAAYDTDTRQFSDVVCRAKTGPAFDLDGTPATGGIGAAKVAACPGASEEVK